MGKIERELKRKTYPLEDPLQNVKNSREREFFAVTETEKRI
jgi:hypothetical protein